MLSELIGIYGGTGAACLALIGCVYKWIQQYEIHYIKGPWIDNIPVETLNNTWEHSYTTSLENSFKRMVFAIHKDNKWVVNIKEGEGSVYIYTDYYNASSTDNNHRFLRVHLKNVPQNANIQFIHKYYIGSDAKEWKPSPQHPPYKEKLAPRNGIHTYFQPSLIGTDGITKEQVGIHFGATEYINTIVDEAYKKEKYSIYNLICCKRHLVTMYYRMKR